MFARFSMTRNPLMRFFAFMSMIWLAACEPVGLSSSANSGQRIDPNAPVQVALLVPGGSGAGSDALLARNLENAARLAVADLNGADIRLQVYNTGADPVMAAQVARTAVAEGAQIILGPLYAEAAFAAGDAVAQSNVNVLAFSNNPTIAGGNVFVLGTTFQNTANRLVRYGAQRGLNRYAVVHAENTGGTIGRDAIVAAVQGNGGQVTGTVGYALSQQAVLNASGRVASAARDADAVFLTAGINAELPLLATTLPEAGVTARLVGLTRWDAAPQAAALPGLQGGLFAVPDLNRSRAFEARYAANFGESPHPLAGLAYDGVAAIGALVASGNRNALTRSALTNRQGFQGTTGVFRLLPNGLNERALSIATFQNNRMVTLEQAPTSFGAGF